MNIIGRMLDAIASRLPQPEEINGANRCPPYLYRWELLSLLGGSMRVYLHKFVGEDWALDLHDHPKRFVSIGIDGRYLEHRADGSTREYTAPWLRSFAAEHRHRLTGPTTGSPCWTLVIVGPPTREWGFWSLGQWVRWREYVAVGSQHARTACENV